MASQALYPENTEERLVWTAIRYTYAFYVLGALYIVGPVLGWILFALFFLRTFGLTNNSGTYAVKRVPIETQAWIIGMLLMLFTLIIGHVDFQLGIAKIIKSSIGWAKGWALLAIFPIAGCLNIRPEIICRATMHVCLQTLFLIPIFVLAWLIGAPQTLYVSPLQAIGGPGPEFFAVSLYEIDPGSGWPRWRIFAPWAPAIGFVANMFFLFALYERDTRWRIIGITAAVMLVLMSGSRLAQISLLAVPAFVALVGLLRSPMLPFLAAFSISTTSLLAMPIFDGIQRATAAFHGMRAGSSRVREVLGRIALDRWMNEAPVWGHGIVERGPHLVEYMPIGSHHTWLGLLFVKGTIGVIALGIPLLLTGAKLAYLSSRHRFQRLGFSLVVLISMYTFGENLEILAYLLWPGLIIVGSALQKSSSEISLTTLKETQTHA